MFPDAGRMRDTIRELGERLSDLGYVVLVPDLYYRNKHYEPVDMRTAFADSTAEKFMEMMRGYTADHAVRDARAFVGYLNRREIGWSRHHWVLHGLSLIAAARWARVSPRQPRFMVGSRKCRRPSQPHHRVSGIRAAVYVAGAIADQFFPDEQKDQLERSLSDAGVVHTIETYQAHHGFAVPDFPTYDTAASERHWKATSSFGSALG